MKPFLLHIQLMALLASIAALSNAGAATLISDTFEVNSAANYDIVNDGTPNGSVNFAYNYVAAGIPLAPNSGVGGGTGVRLTANDSSAAVDAYTLFHKTAVSAPHYIVIVDVYMGFTGTAGTTEYAQIGVGGDGSTFNSVFTPISGSGSFIAFTGDGGSASDYRWYRSAVNSFADDPATAPAIPSTTLANTHPSYLGHGSNNTGAFYTTLFPLGSRTAPSVAGSPGNMWTTVKIEVNNGTINYFFDNVLTFSGQYTGSLDGRASLGINDPNATSVDPGTVYTLYDNFSVEIVPEPGLFGLLGLTALPALLRRRRHS